VEFVRSVLSPYRSVLSPYRSVLPPYRSVLPPYRSVLPPYRSVLSPYRSVLSPYLSVLPPYRKMSRCLSPLIHNLYLTLQGPVVSGTRTAKFDLRQANIFHTQCSYVTRTVPTVRSHLGPNRTRLFRFKTEANLFSARFDLNLYM